MSQSKQISVTLNDETRSMEAFYIGGARWVTHTMPFVCLVGKAGKKFWPCNMYFTQVDDNYARPEFRTQRYNKLARIVGWRFNQEGNEKYSRDQLSKA